MGISEITATFEQGRAKWTGCQWSTQFGNQQLNLQGLKSSQAALMARSTAGKEAAEWKAAMRWLEQVEQDAREAEMLAELATALASQGRIEQSLKHIQKACALESNYNECRIWRPLYEAIVTAIDEISLNGSASSSAGPTAPPVVREARQSEGRS